MIFTNKLDLPQPIVSAVTKDFYSKGDSDVSVTGLLKPPRLAVLERQHKEQITEDVSSRIWSLMGQVIHGILERADTTGMVERRLAMEMEGWKVSGQIDRYETGTIQDFKVTSCHKLTQGNLDDWSSQLNLYAALLRHHGYAVNKLQVVAILRDWSKLEAKRNPNYPQAQVVNVNIPLWDPDKALAFMRDRVILHQQARVSLPECSAEERWARPDVYAVMKNGKKRAAKLCATVEEALALACTEKDYYVVRRPGINIRCEEYCALLPFCAQGKGLVQYQKPRKENDDAVCA
jgi:hypothetical protein